MGGICGSFLFRAVGSGLSVNRTETLGFGPQAASSKSKSPALKPYARAKPPLVGAPPAATRCQCAFQLGRGPLLECRYLRSPVAAQHEGKGGTANSGIAGSPEFKPCMLQTHAPRDLEERYKDRTSTEDIVLPLLQDMSIAPRMDNTPPSALNIRVEGLSFFPACEAAFHGDLGVTG